MLAATHMGYNLLLLQVCLYFLVAPCSYLINTIFLRFIHIPLHLL
jgi:hypothetical protein